MKKIIGLVTVFSLTVCSGTAFAQKSYRLYKPILSASTRIEVSYFLRRSSLLGDYDIVITNKGDVILSGHDYFNSLSAKTVVKNAKLSPQQLEDFREFIVDSNIFQYDETYVVNCKAVQLDSQRLRVSINGKVKEIIISAATIPQGLRTVIERIEQIKSRIK
jgi:hypothetical protein